MTLADVVVRLEQMEQMCTMRGCECPKCSRLIDVENPALERALAALRLDLDIAILRAESQ